MRIFLSAVLLGLMAAASPAHAQQSSIVAVVNEDAISRADMMDRMKLSIISAGLPDTPEIRQKLLPQVLNGLIEERLMMQEAARNKISVGPADVQQGFEVLAKQNNMPIERFNEIMKGQGVPKRTLDQQIEAQIAWSRVIQDIIKPQIEITDKDIQDRIERLSGGVGKSQYLASEIFLPVDEPSREADVRALAARLVSEIRDKKAPFQRVAAQFSAAAGGAQGGTLGWVQEGQLSEDLDRILPTLQDGGISEPIKTADGYHILMVQSRRALTRENLPPREQIINQIGMERLDRMQRRLLSDLKGSAFIDQRVSN